jgi:hypothetical protein
MQLMEALTYEPRKVIDRDEWNAWLVYLGEQQDHECPPGCKGVGCHIDMQSCSDCPTDWRHGL